MLYRIGSRRGIQRPHSVAGEELGPDRRLHPPPPRGPCVRCSVQPGSPPHPGGRGSSGSWNERGRGSFRVPSLGTGVPESGWDGVFLGTFPKQSLRPQQHHGVLREAEEARLWGHVLRKGRCSAGVVVQRGARLGDGVRCTRTWTGVHALTQAHACARARTHTQTPKVPVQPPTSAASQV